MLSRVVAFALVASVAVLAGCTHTPPPKPTTDAAYSAFMDQQNGLWWRSMFPNEDPPVVTVVKFIDPFDSGSLVTDCILAENIPGVDLLDGTLEFTESDQATNDLFRRTQYVCHLQYPYMTAAVSDLGIMSTDELEYLYSYFTQRLAPCLEFMGYRVSAAPSHDSFLYSAPYIAWSPYEAMTPKVTTAEEWKRVDARCPTPAVGMFWREGAGY